MVSTHLSDRPPPLPATASIQPRMRVVHNARGASVRCTGALSPLPVFSISSNLSIYSQIISSRRMRPATGHRCTVAACCTPGRRSQPGAVLSSWASLKMFGAGSQRL